MIPVSNNKAVRIVPPVPTDNKYLVLSDGSIAYTWNKTVWIVKEKKVTFEYRHSSQLTALASYSDCLLA